jgi:2-methylisocitrate lyase-like PEP mutase family enzyme
MANMVPTGKSPVVPAERLQAYGFNVAIYPVAGMAVACAALEANYRHLREHGSTAGSPVPAYTMAQLHELTGFPEVWEFERRYTEV